VGCSTIAINLAIALHEQLDVRVLLMEGKMIFGHLGLMLNLRPQNTIADLIPHAGALDDSLVEEVVSRHASGIDVLLGPPDLNVGQGTNGAENTVRFERAEVMIPFKCDVHGWMGAYLGVVAHPFFAVTADDGAVTLPKLPPGTYVVEAWHEVYGAQQQTVTVAAGETKALAFGFQDK